MPTSELETSLHNAIGSVLRLTNGCSDAPISLHEPHFGHQDQDAVSQCLSDGWPSSAGSTVSTFENALSDRMRVKHCVACVNGTSALHIAFKLVGVEAGDEVVQPAISFVGTANAAQYCQAEVRFLDVSDTDFGLCPDALSRFLGENAERQNGRTINRQTGRPIGAITAVHCFGYACQIEAIAAVAAKYEIPLVEDAAESLGTTVNDQHLGTFGAVGVLSFNGNKIVTTGGGGAIVTNDPRLAEEARHITTTAKQAHRWNFVHDQLGYNYRMPGLNAALGLGQLNKLDAYLQAKHALHTAYAKSFAGIEGVSLLDGNLGEVSNHWLNTITIPSWDLSKRNAFLERMHMNNIFVRPVWDMLPTLPHLGSHDSNFWPVAKRIIETSVSLPSSPTLWQSKF